MYQLRGLRDEHFQLLNVAEFQVNCGTGELLTVNEVDFTNQVTWQRFYGTTGAITNASESIAAPIVVDGAPAVLAAVELFIDANITTAALPADTDTSVAVSDVAVTLVSPTGTSVQIHVVPGDATVSWDYVILSDLAATGIGDVSSPYGDMLSPQNPLAAFAGENPNGTWELRLADDASVSGTIYHLSIAVH